MKATRTLILWGGLLLCSAGGIFVVLLLSRSDMVTSLFVVGGVVGGEVLLFSRMVKKVLSPLEEIASAAAEITRGNLTGCLTRERSSTLPDEFDVCARALSDLSSVIGNTGKKIALFFASLSSLRGELLHSIEKGDGDVPPALPVMKGSIGEITESLQTISRSVDELSSYHLHITADVPKVFSEIRTFSSSVAETFSPLSQMLALTKNMAESTDILAMAAEETASSIGEISTTVKEVEHNAKESAALAGKVSIEAQEIGIQSIEKAGLGIKKIQEAVEKSALVIQRLGGRVEHIGKFLTVIEEVTKQTTLLSLNASILAAQAGEQGKGFAVVADEIKRLADRTTASTQEITQLVANVQKEAREAVKSIEEEALSVEEGIKRSLEATDLFKNILMSFKKASERAQQIEAATREQAKGIRHVAESMNQITGMIRQIVQAAAEQSRLSEDVGQMMAKMQAVGRQVTMWIEDQAQGGKGASGVVSQMTKQMEKIRKIVEAHAESEREREAILAEFYKERAEREEEASRMTHALSLLEKEIRSVEQEAAWLIKNRG